MAHSGIEHNFLQEEFYFSHFATSMEVAFPKPSFTELVEWLARVLYQFAMQVRQLWRQLAVKTGTSLRCATNLIIIFACSYFVSKQYDLQITVLSNT